ncbi:hypothetical protein KCP78_00875 [Salmonella enterica subsp. enterica]|nr:hypothetical protein KCP78_00875 [Salmonella enterica subsp. enterica]
MRRIYVHGVCGISRLYPDRRFCRQFAGRMLALSTARYDGTSGDGGTAGKVLLLRSSGPVAAFAGKPSKLADILVDRVYRKSRARRLDEQSRRECV